MEQLNQLTSLLTSFEECRRELWPAINDLLPDSLFGMKQDDLLSHTIFPALLNSTIFGDYNCAKAERLDSFEEG